MAPWCKKLILFVLWPLPGPSPSFLILQDRAPEQSRRGCDQCQQCYCPAVPFRHLYPPGFSVPTVWAGLWDDGIFLKSSPQGTKSSRERFLWPRGLPRYLHHREGSRGRGLPEVWQGEITTLQLPAAIPRYLSVQTSPRWMAAPP